MAPTDGSRASHLVSSSALRPPVEALSVLSSMLSPCRNLQGDGPAAGATPPAPRRRNFFRQRPAAHSTLAPDALITGANFFSSAARKAAVSLGFIQNSVAPCWA